MVSALPCQDWVQEQGRHLVPPSKVAPHPPSGPWPLSYPAPHWRVAGEEALHTGCTTGPVLQVPWSGEPASLKHSSHPPAPSHLCLRAASPQLVKERPSGAPTPMMDRTGQPWPGGSARRTQPKPAGGLPSLAPQEKRTVLLILTK